MLLQVYDLAVVGDVNGEAFASAAFYFTADGFTKAIANVVETALK